MDPLKTYSLWPVSDEKLAFRYTLALVLHFVSFNLDLLALDAISSKHEALELGFVSWQMNVCGKSMRFVKLETIRGCRVKLL